MLGNTSTPRELAVVFYQLRNLIILKQVLQSHFNCNVHVMSGTSGNIKYFITNTLNSVVQP